MNRKCYFIAFSVVVLAVGYPIILTVILSKTSKDEQSSSTLPGEQQCNCIIFT